MPTPVSQIKHRFVSVTTDVLYSVVVQYQPLATWKLRKMSGHFSSQKLTPNNFTAAYSHMVELYAHFIIPHELFVEYLMSHGTSCKTWFCSRDYCGRPLASSFVECSTQFKCLISNESCLALLYRILRSQHYYDKCYTSFITYHRLLKPFGMPPRQVHGLWISSYWNLRRSKSTEFILHDWN